jgi:hypothetical protein
VRASVAAALLLVGLLAGCDRDEGEVQEKPAVKAERCLVRLHGKGGEGAAPSHREGIAVVSPAGNGDGWGGKQWLYFPDSEYDEALGVVENAVEGCGRIILNGFSNGASFATRLYCSGEDFDGRLESVVIDDPVTDDSSKGCQSAPDVSATLYWTGALEGPGRPGASCAAIDWTCQGGRTVGISEYAARLGIRVKESPLREHEWYLDAPELSQWD